MAQPQVVNWARDSFSNAASGTATFSGWTTTAGNSLAVFVTGFANDTQNWAVSTTEETIHNAQGQVIETITWGDITLSDGSGSFIQLENSGSTGNFGKTQLFFGQDVNGGCSSLTVQISPTPDQGKGWITVFEIANLDPSTPIDGHDSHAGAITATNFASGSPGAGSRGNQVYLGFASTAFEDTTSYTLTGPAGWTNITSKATSDVGSGSKEWYSIGGWLNATSIQSPNYEVTFPASAESNSYGGAAAILVLNGTLPSISTTGLPAGYASSAYSQTLSASNGSGGYTWSLSSGALPTGLSLGSGGVISGTPSAAGTYNFTVEVTDSAGGTDTQALSIVIDAALAITTASLGSGYINAGYSATLAATGGSGSGYTWSVSSGSLPPGISLSGAGVFSGEPTGSGTFTFTAEVTDSASNSVTKSLSITVYPLIAITTASLANGEVTDTYSQTLAASGGTGTGYTWSVSSGSLPAGLSLSSTGVISGTPTASGTVSFTVLVKDSGSHSTTKNLSIDVAVFELPVTPGTLPQGTTGAAYSQTLTASGGTSPYTFTVPANSLPTGMTLSSAGVLGGTPTNTFNGSFTITVTDNIGRQSSQVFSLLVYAPLSITTTSLPQYLTGTAYSTPMASTGGDGTNTWSVSSGTLPAGLSLTSAGVLSGTPTTTGAYTFTIEVEDTDSRIATHAFTGAVYPPLSVSTASLAQGYQTVSYSQTLAASGGSGTGYTWSIVAGSLPAGLSLNTASGAITGTPLDALSYSFTVQVQDSAGLTATKALSINVRQALAVATTSLPQGSITVAYFQQLAFTGGSGVGIAWTVTSGTLPTSLTLSSGGALSGTPSATGTFTFTVKVTDSAGNTASESYTVKIVPVPPTISTSALSNATAGQYYSQALATQSGTGTGPFAWSIVSGTLPDGLYLLGSVITGSTMTLGTYFVTVEVTDANNSSAEKTLSITVVQQLAGIPATYSLADYDEVLYGETVTPTKQITVVNEFVIEPMVAQSLTYQGIGVSWTKPLAATDGTAMRWRLISNRYGYPVDQNDGNILLDTPNWLGQFYFDTAVIPDTYHYYGIYAQVNPNSAYATANGNGNQWVRVGVTGCLAIEQADTQQWLLDRLPAYFRDFLNGNLTQDAAGNQYIQQFMQVLGWGIDYVRGQYDMQFLHQNDPMQIPIDDLVNLAAQLGMPFDPYVSVYLMRQAAANWAHVATQRGTTLGIENQVELLTGFDVDLTLSQNQLLEDDQSWFPDPAFSSWNDYTTYHAGEFVTFVSGSNAWAYQDATPVAPVLSWAATGGTVAAGTYQVALTYVSSYGETAGSASASKTTTGSTSTLTINSPAAATGATAWYAYITATNGTTYKSASTAIGTNLTLTALPGTTVPQPPEANVGNTPSAGSSSAYWTLMANTTDPDGTLYNAATDGANTWEVLYPLLTNGQVAAWASGTAYTAGQYVSYNGYIYKCAVANTGIQPSGSKTSTTDWTWVNSVDETLGNPDPGNSSLKLANTLHAVNKAGATTDLAARTISRTVADKRTTSAFPFVADKLQAINDGIPVPFTLPNQAWSPTVRYGTGDIVVYDGLPYLALRASTGATPGLAAYANEWQQLSTDPRLRMMINAETYASATVPVTPFVEWFDQWGNFIARVVAGNSSSPGTPANVAFDAFTQNPGNTISGRALDTSGYTWTAQANDFTVSGYAGGAVYPNTLASRSIALTTGPANGNVGLTLVSTQPNQAQGQGIVFRYSAGTYWVLEAFGTGFLGLYTYNGAVYTSAGGYTGVNPGDRLVVNMNGNAITVKLNGTTVITANNSFNASATQHGIIVE